jgi:pimeloyl-ACP methyl ester carboxylesterase
VIVPDMRGYGESSKPAEVEAYSIPMLAIDFVGILDHLGLQRAHFVGHDWGGRGGVGMGVWSSGDIALLEEQMANSAKYVNTFRYERIAGPRHWMQWEAPDTVSELLLDFLPR